LRTPGVESILSTELVGIYNGFDRWFTSLIPNEELPPTNLCVVWTALKNDPIHILNQSHLENIDVHSISEFRQEITSFQTGSAKPLLMSNSEEVRWVD
jgi:hypothetical protein